MPARPAARRAGSRLKQVPTGVGRHVSSGRLGQHLGQFLLGSSRACLLQTPSVSITTARHLGSDARIHLPALLTQGASCCAIAWHFSLLVSCLSHQPICVERPVLYTFLTAVTLPLPPPRPPPAFPASHPAHTAQLALHLAQTIRFGRPFPRCQLGLVSSIPPPPRYPPVSTTRSTSTDPYDRQPFPSCCHIAVAFLMLWQYATPQMRCIACANPPCVSGRALFPPRKNGWGRLPGDTRRAGPLRPRLC